MRARIERLRQRLTHLLAHYQRRTLVEWCLLMVSALLFSGVIAVTDGTRRADNAVYDIALRMAAARQTPSPDITIVAIDDGSLSAIGRWPWPRTVLARLITGIANDQPDAIGVDVILSEPDAQHPADDAALAAAIANAGNVVLPALIEVSPDGLKVRRPFAGLRSRVGHINMSLDLDGVARQVYLDEAIAGDHLTNFAAVIARTAANAGMLPPCRYDAGHGKYGDDWGRQHLFRMPFVGPPGSFATVSAADVLNGKLPAGFFQGKTVLVGATASGLGDTFPTPMARNGEGMSGIEIIANTVQALRAGGGIVALPRPWFWALTALLILASGLASLLLPPRRALLGALACSTGALVLCLLLMAGWQIWFAPAIPVLVTALIYPLWSWRRQEAALRFLTEELARLKREPGLLDLIPEVPGMHGHLDARMQDVSRLSTGLRDLRQFLADGLEALTEATVICDPAGQVLLANRRMHWLAPSMLGSLGESPRQPAHIHDVMREIFVAPDAGLTYWDTLRRTNIYSVDAPARSAEPPPAVEMTLRNDRQVLLRSAPLRGGTGHVAGMILTCIDITELRLSERNREESLRFISHDMRSPQASILALIELQQTPDLAQPEPDLLARIGDYAQKTMQLADDFIHLARAEAPNWSFMQTDIAGLVLDATDEFWPLATSRHIRLDVSIEPDDCIAQVEPFLLVRAIANLVSNAIKYSAVHTTVSVRLYGVTNGYAIDVVDEGIGIATDEQQRLFQPFQRLQGNGTHHPAGAGLGLAFVRTVVERHGGSIVVSSAPGAGSRFTMTMPKKAFPSVR